MEFLDTLVQVKNSWGPYKNWAHSQTQKEQQNQELLNKYPPSPEEIARAKQYGRTVIETINMMDQHSIDKSEDASLIIKNLVGTAGAIGGGAIGATIGVLLKKVPAFKKSSGYILGAMGFSIGASLVNLVGNIFEAQIEKKASRIARFQTRANELKDPRNFVIYTDEQIKQAKEIAKTLPEVEEKRKDTTLKQSSNPVKSIKKANATANSLRKDYSNYKNWQDKFEKEQEEKQETFKTLNVPKEELQKAEKERDNILHTIKKIENYSLNYMMNMKLAVFGALIAVDGLEFGSAFGLFKLIDHLQNKNILRKESAFVNWTKVLPFKITPFLNLLTIGPVVKLLKDSARIGRFKAKQELLAHPENFISFDDQQREDIKTKQAKEAQQNPLENLNFIDKFKKDLKETENFKNDYKIYQNYMKNEHKEELKLNEALKKVNITKDQEIEAKELQRKAFLSFEKMDEKSQRFIDDTDAGVDTIRHIILTCVSIPTKIWMFSLFNKKLNIYNKGQTLKFTDMFTLLKHFKANELLQIIGISLIPHLFAIPLAVKGIQIKKEAGNIGVMRAMQELDDPKHYLDSDKQKPQASS